ncbi:class I SAM-dependent methyltransferase [Chitinophaga filiformis]|uniref:methyltransferase domain-containing protein n=1 Tax=Chitinophaga filiformis TaxID=104663 RepID=UPI001F3D3F31|nr:methyltransferase domain-containing protein [Chitinophaga filiformis]MCF6402532.1 class I SAM-dependent methyltransferase [Chitinophaga filiformis]MCF6403550.1 class I SAM-dependent methyltransferase [Chitinophaga filiformis]
MIDALIPEKYMVEWSGWPLTDNRFGEEFDRDARIRMVMGGRRLIPYLLKNRRQLKGDILEIGPFFTPLLYSPELREVLPASASITFLENDRDALQWLRDQGACRLLNLDMNAVSFAEDLQQQLAGEVFDNIIISQVLNYVDYKSLLAELFTLVKSGGHLFINNVCDYGLPILFSGKRPSDNESVIAASLAAGFSIKEQRVIPKYFRKEPADRLILVLQRP